MIKKKKRIERSLLDSCMIVYIQVYMGILYLSSYSMYDYKGKNDSLGRNRL